MGQIDDAFAQIEELGEQARELAVLPDRFNRLFSSRGWIAYEMLNIDIAKAAVALGESGDFVGAEERLTDHYSGETIRWHLTLMNAVRAFRPRAALAGKALTDYAEGRYHACVPVTLGLLDGMDLGYDNKLVAAKAWAALFATREWALRAARRPLGPQPAKPRPGWRTLFQQMAETNAERRLIEAWKPRNLRIGKDMPRSGPPGAYGEGTPERRLVEVPESWRIRNYGWMATVISVCLFVKEAGILAERTFEFRLIREDEGGRATTGARPGAAWSIYSYAV